MISVVRLSFVVVMALAAAACTSPDVADGSASATESDPREGELVDALSEIFVSEGGPLPIDAPTSRCIAAGTVASLGVDALADAGVTVDDPDGPTGDPYAQLDDTQLRSVVSVWTGCADVPAMVHGALLAGGPDVLDAGVDDCLSVGLSAGLADRFLFEALADESDGSAVNDVLRLVDGCNAGAASDVFAETPPALWPWVTVQLPGYNTALVPQEAVDAAALTPALEGGNGVSFQALEVTTDDGALASVLIVAAIEPDNEAGVSPDLYAAGIVASAGEQEVFPITLPGGAEVVGWEDPDAELVFLVWAGERMVVLATGPLPTVDVLALYTDLVPSA